LHVTARPLEAPLVLVGDKPDPNQPAPPLRVLIVQEGLIEPHIVEMLNSVLADV
jgi:hypothetical protein